MKSDEIPSKKSGDDKDMYVSLKERKNKKGVASYYIYLCVSKRMDGKVVNKQRYFGSINETKLLKNDFSFLLEAMQEEVFTPKEIWMVEDKLKAKLQELLDKNTE